MSRYINTDIMYSIKQTDAGIKHIVQYKDRSFELGLVVEDCLNYAISYSDQTLVTNCIRHHETILEKIHLGLLEMKIKTLNLSQIYDESEYAVLITNIINETRFNLQYEYRDFLKEYKTQIQEKVNRLTFIEIMFYVKQDIDKIESISVYSEEVLKLLMDTKLFKRIDKTPTLIVKKKGDK